MLDPAGFADGRRLITVIRTDRPMELVAPEDIGKAAAAAINDPATFNGVTLQLAGELLTFPQIVEILSRLDGKEYVVQSGTVEEAVAAGLHPAGPDVHERRPGAGTARARPLLWPLSHEFRDVGPPAARDGLTAAL